MEVKTLTPFGGGAGEGALDKKTDHAAQKPVELMRRPIMLHTDEGDAVYDPFMGSGTTMMAANSVKRVAFGCELLPQFVAVALERYFEATGDTPKRLE
jgi:DNA modification methylase